MSERHELSGRLLGICDALEAGCQLNKPKLKSYLYRASEILAKPDSQEIESLRAEVELLKSCLVGWREHDWPEGFDRRTAEMMVANWEMRLPKQQEQDKDG